MFSPPAIPAARPSQNVFDIALGEPLPWSTGHPLRRQRLTKHQTWRHIAYVGMYPREAVFSALRSVFPAAADGLEGRPLGASALLAFAVSDKGEMLEGSVVLSACAWATARALDPGPRSAVWLDGPGPSGPYGSARRSPSIGAVIGRCSTSPTRSPTTG